MNNKAHLRQLIRQLVSDSRYYKKAYEEEHSERKRLAYYEQAYNETIQAVQTIHEDISERLDTAQNRRT